MLTPRRIEIFKAIVDEFVQTAEPVGSKTLMEKYQLPYSSATIRNDMMVLEEMGLAPGIRGEALELSQFAELSSRLKDKSE